MSFMDDVYADLQRVQEVKCLNQANASPQVAAIDAKIHDLAKNWNPTGFYAPGDVETMLAKITAGNGAARAALATASFSTSDAGQVIRQAQAYLNRNDERSQLYRTAVQNARNTGATVINAPGFKTYVTNSLVNISQAFVTVAALDCRTSWLDTVGKIAEDITAFGKQIGGLIAKAGDIVVSAAEGIFALYPALKWFLLFGGLLAGGIFIVGRGKRFYRQQIHQHLPDFGDEE